MNGEEVTKNVAPLAVLPLVSVARKTERLEFDEEFEYV